MHMHGHGLYVAWIRAVVGLLTKPGSDKAALTTRLHISALTATIHASDMPTA